MLVKDLLSILDSIAPFILQEEYDNSGLQFGNLNDEISKILIAVDLTKQVVEEAKEHNANVILTHHPVFFKPVKSIEKNRQESLYEAITNRINIVSFHTNFDISESGLNDYFLEILGIKKIKPIIPSKEKIYKIITFVPEEFAETVRKAMFDAGAGHIGNYDECSFNTLGTGTFRPLENANPFIGTLNERSYVKEVKVEVIVKERDLPKVLQNLKKSHPYEEPAIDVFETLFEKNYGIGAIGETETLPLKSFINYIKEKANIPYARVIGNLEKIVKKLAICTGACGSLISNLPNDIDVFITGDITYHVAIEIVERGLTVIDIDHFETEKFFKVAMFEKLKPFINEELLLISRKEKSPFNLI